MCTQTQFHDGSAVTTGFPFYNWKNVIKLIPVLIQPDLISFLLPLCLSGVPITKHVPLLQHVACGVFISVIYKRETNVSITVSVSILKHRLSKENEWNIEVLYILPSWIIHFLFANQQRFTLQLNGNVNYFFIFGLWIETFGWKGSALPAMFCFKGGLILFSLHLLIFITLNNTEYWHLYPWFH